MNNKNLNPLNDPEVEKMLALSPEDQLWSFLDDCVPHDGKDAVVHQPKMTADEVRVSKEEASKTNEATLLKIVKEQAAEIEKLKAELSSAKQALEAKDAEYTKLKAEYSALQTKYVMSAELFAERVYKMAMSKSAGIAQEQETDNDNLILVG